jgi:hypothetical protein
MTEDADAEGEINQIVFAELVTHVVETQRGSTECVIIHGISIVTGRNKCWSNIFFQKPVKPLVLCEMVLALGFLTAIYFSDVFC